MALLVIGIMYIWYKEWCDLEKLEVQNRHIDTFCQESHETLSTNGNGQYAMPFQNDLSDKAHRQCTPSS